VELVGAERVLFGTDYPLLAQERALRQVGDAGLPARARRLVLGENVRRLLGVGRKRKGAQTGVAPLPEQRAKGEG